MDQYCIDQNDAVMRIATIESMDLVYSSAALTIIAASGADASSGLPGIRGTIKRPQNILIRNQMKYLISDDIRDEICASHWDTRGWTYQEAILSARTLTLTDSQVFFQCKERHCIEELSHNLQSPIRSVPNSRLSGEKPISNGEPLAICYLLEQYFPRNFTMGSDSLAAFEGILNAHGHNGLRSSSMTHFYGIPLLHNQLPNMIAYSESLQRSFIKGLSWALIFPAAYDRTLRTNASEGSGFSSWTWAAHEAAYPAAMNYLVEGPYDLELSGDILVQIEHKTDGCLDFARAMVSHHRMHDNDRFYPWVDITALTLRVSVSSSVTAAVLYRELRDVSASMDEDGRWEQKEVIALHLGTCADEGNELSLQVGNDLMFLMVIQENPEEQVWRRIGNLQVRCSYCYAPFHTGMVGVAKFIEERGNEPNIEFLERRTFRIV
jgi:hypothetical protein